MIRVLALDIDGVLTDGKVAIAEDGRETKTLSYRDIDAVFEARRLGLIVALLTGEDSLMAGTLAGRLKVDRLYRAAKDKMAALLQLAQDIGCSPSEICYIGDSKKDAPALAAAGTSFAPADASAEALAAAKRVLSRRGGDGAVSEALAILRESQLHEAKATQ